jgi:alkylation response protein AidB-like acyl-CoA dehydrogenase
MGLNQRTWPVGPGEAARQAQETFAPIFARIAEGAVAREVERVLPHEQIGWLKSAGFGALRVPVAHGGAGLTIPELFALLVDLAAADSNVVQALRGHFAFVEDILARPEPVARPWFDRFVKGEIVGNAWSETGPVKLGERNTKLSAAGADFRLDGEKFYSTGAIFAEWIDVLASRAEDGAAVIAAVDTRQAGVVRSDDWKGFGQRTTGSGTTVFRAAHVAAVDVFPFETRFPYQTAFYQTVLNAVLAGSAAGAVRDAATFLKARTRTYSHGTSLVAAGDPQLLQVIGKAHALASAARAVTLAGAEAVQRAFEARAWGDAERERAANVEAELASARAQSAAGDLALRVAGDVFNALSASATDHALAIDRHWRNARTALNHNPLVFKERILGDHVVNGTEPPFLWQIGTPDLPASEGDRHGKA